MRIVSAGMHNMRIFRCIGSDTFFVYRQTVHISSDCYERTFTDISYHACFADALFDSIPELFKLIGCKLCRFEFMKTQLGMLMQVASQPHDLRL